MSRLTIIGACNSDLMQTRHSLGGAFTDWLIKAFGRELYRAGTACRFITQKGCINDLVDFCNRIGVHNQDFLCVVDDIDVDFGKIKLSVPASSSTHNAVRGFLRQGRRPCLLRIGIKGSFKTLNEYVLGPFSPLESVFWQNRIRLLAGIFVFAMRGEFSLYRLQRLRKQGAYVLVRGPLRLE